jgi:hypothetical protein
MDFQIIVKHLCQSFFECQNLSNSFIFYFFPHFTVMPKDFLINRVGLFRETDSVTHKKGAGRPIVRIEEIVTRNKLRRTFSNPWPPLTKIIFDIPVDATTKHVECGKEKRDF